MLSLPLSLSLLCVWCRISSSYRLHRSPAVVSAFTALWSNTLTKHRQIRNPIAPVDEVRVLPMRPNGANTNTHTYTHILKQCVQNRDNGMDLERHYLPVPLNGWWICEYVRLLVIGRASRQRCNSFLIEIDCLKPDGVSLEDKSPVSCVLQLSRISRTWWLDTKQRERENGVSLFTVIEDDIERWCSKFLSY